MRRLPRLVPALLPLVLSFPASLRAQAGPDVADPLATYAGRPIVSRPDYFRLAERDGMVEFWHARGYPDGCRLAESPERHLDCDPPTP